MSEQEEFVFPPALSKLQSKHTVTMKCLLINPTAAWHCFKYILNEAKAILPQLQGQEKDDAGKCLHSIFDDMDTLVQQNGNDITGDQVGVQAVLQVASTWFAAGVKLDEGGDYAGALTAFKDAAIMFVILDKLNEGGLSQQLKNCQKHALVKAVKIRKMLASQQQQQPQAQAPPPQQQLYQPPQEQQTNQWGAPPPAYNEPAPQQFNAYNPQQGNTTEPDYFGEPPSTGNPSNSGFTAYEPQSNVPQQQFGAPPQQHFNAPPQQQQFNAPPPQQQQFNAQFSSDFDAVPAPHNTSSLTSDASDATSSSFLSQPPENGSISPNLPPVPTILGHRTVQPKETPSVGGFRPYGGPDASILDDNGSPAVDVSSIQKDLKNAIAALQFDKFSSAREYIHAALAKMPS